MNERIQKKIWKEFEKEKLISKKFRRRRKIVEKNVTNTWKQTKPKKQ